MLVYEQLMHHTYVPPVFRSLIIWLRTWLFTAEGPQGGNAGWERLELAVNVLQKRETQVLHKNKRTKKQKQPSWINKLFFFCTLAHTAWPSVLSSKSSKIPKKIQHTRWEKKALPGWTLALIIAVFPTGDCGGRTSNVLRLSPKENAQFVQFTAQSVSLQEQE